MKKSKCILSWFLQIAIAVILAQTLYFKFTGHGESVVLFRELGMEPTGRLLIGSLELLAVILLLIRHSVAWGALLAWGLMSGAIVAHFTTLGWEGDRGVLGSLAVFCWIGASLILLIRYDELPFLKMDTADSS